MIIVFFLILFIFRNFFSFSGTLSSGDWPYLFPAMIKEFSLYPLVKYIWLAPYYQIPIKMLVGNFGVPWEIVERLLWIIGFLGIGIFSSWYFAKHVMKKSTFSPLSVLIYLTNTYILMLVGGGQFGVVLSYAFAPFVLTRFLLYSKETLLCTTLSKKQFFRSSMSFGVVFGLAVMFDPRIAYILILCFLSYLFIFPQLFKKIWLLLSGGVIVSTVSLLINSFWIVPFLISSDKTLGDFTFSDTSLGALRFFSFASFSQSFSLLHPNWPENVFGKTSFLQPEFLLVPLFAFFSLLVIGKEKKNAKRARMVVYFAFIGLLGGFLGKGSQAPFGNLFEWIFLHIPGFVSFRDPTKFYLLTALSYCVLIPWSLELLTKKVYGIKYKALSKIANQHTVSYILYSLFILFWLFTIRQTVTGTLSGTFQAHFVPLEYRKLAELLEKDSHFGKTLWIPDSERFGFSSANHPIVSGATFFKENKHEVLLKKVQEKKSLHALQKNAITYVIVPYDSESEIFLKDRKYDANAYKNTLLSVGKIDWLKKNSSFTFLGVFSVKDSHLPTPDSYGKLSNIQSARTVREKQHLANIGTGLSVFTMISVCGLFLIL